MIVVDTNLVVYAVIGHPVFTPWVHASSRKDRDWHAPRGWRTELAGVLTRLVRGRQITKSKALRAWNESFELLITAHDYDETSLLPFALSRNVTAYDARFVQCALSLGCKVVTNDAGPVANCPDVVVSLQAFASDESASPA